MKKIFIFITLIFMLFNLGVRASRAQNIAESSASLAKDNESSLDVFDYRVVNLRNFLEKYNSPLAEYAEEFVKYADLYKIDYRLVPAISGVESTFGKKIPYDSYNAYGWANGDYKFESWPDSIATVSSVLKKNYIDHGSVSIKQISRIYAPPSTTWGGNVSYFMYKIDTLPLDFDII